ncbi:hypothetical protein [Actibacterium ureilyticum]|uniref:hypothetical protein n=1 Tax=Actibacterium ureilyticum TaxID=1590614 RepID=UPI000BAAE7E6|nr:hypothetical protein [Actibacterium ureilyticum]
MRFLIWLLLMLPALARAQSLTLGEYPQVQTHFGLLSVVETPQQGVSRLYLEGYTQPLHENRWITIRGAFIAPGETANWVLVQTMHSGNMCPVSYLVLRIEQGRLNRSEPFGDCLGRIADAQLVPGRFTLVLNDPDLNVAARRFTFDGAQITEETLAAAPNTAAPAGAGTDVTRWIGQAPAALFQDPGERARFATILTAEDLENLRVSISVANRTEVRGDWVFGAGCMPHQCNAQAGFWGLRISDGAAVAGIFHAGGAHRYFGAPQVLSDPTVGAFVAEKALR